MKAWESNIRKVEPYVPGEQPTRSPGFLPGKTLGNRSPGPAEIPAPLFSSA